MLIIFVQDFRDGDKVARERVKNSSSGIDTDAAHPFEACAVACEASSELPSQNVIYVGEVQVEREESTALGTETEEEGRDRGGEGDRGKMEGEGGGEVKGEGESEEARSGEVRGGGGGESGTFMTGVGYEKYEPRAECHHSSSLHSDSLSTSMAGDHSVYSEYSSSHSRGGHGRMDSRELEFRNRNVKKYKKFTPGPSYGVKVEGPVGTGTVLKVNGQLLERMLAVCGGRRKVLRREEREGGAVRHMSSFSRAYRGAGGVTAMIAGDFEYDKDRDRDGDEDGDGDMDSAMDTKEDWGVDTVWGGELDSDMDSLMKGSTVREDNERDDGSLEDDSDSEGGETTFGPYAPHEIECAVVIQRWVREFQIPLRVRVYKETKEGTDDSRYRYCSD